MLFVERVETKKILDCELNWKSKFHWLKNFGDFNENLIGWFQTS